MNTEHKSNIPKSIRDLWRTPKYVFDYFDAHYNFDLDLAASHENHLCEHYLTAEDDSLNRTVVLDKIDAMSKAGDKCDAIWINPPYSDIRPWVEQAIYLYDCGHRVAMLLPSDTSVKWFKLAFDECTECNLISGRLAFINENTKKPVSGNNKGSVVFIFDPYRSEKQDTCVISRDSMKQH